MGERALTTAPEETDMAHRRTGGSQAESPAIRLLDALRNGDDRAVLSECGENTLVTADNMRWSCRGRDEIYEWLQEARERFPGLTFESRTRHIGFGLVIDEARVRDVQPERPADEVDEAEDEPPLEEAEAAHAPGALAPPEDGETPRTAGSDHPMWDEPATEERNVLQLWREGPVADQGPVPLNMPVRVTVRHDDLQVHEISLSFPAALFKRALGLSVDPLEMSLSEVQSAFIAPVGAGFTTYTLARPELTLVPPPALDAEPEPAEPEPPRRRRRRWLVPLLLLLVLLGAGGAWYAVQGREASPAAGPSPSPSPSLSLSPSPSPSPSAASEPTTQATQGTQPTTQPSDRPSRKPNVTLKSDLAFGFNSATLSAKAKAAIAAVAGQVERAGLTGTIYVDGYTDDIGSAAYGQVLSQKRADAVATYLRSRLPGADVTVAAVGHGEADPVASNATAAGRQANRRVTITLPQP
jgi:outer membrane protein OmpA-like peptidoglycan-associated protein